MSEFEKNNPVHITGLTEKGKNDPELAEAFKTMMQKASKATEEHKPNDLCAETHTPCPTGYLQWHAWAERMSRTHKQKRCSHCGLFAIWVPKKDKNQRRKR
jgi:hypothetical protein